MDPVPTLITPILMVFLTIIGGYLLKDRFDRIENRIEAQGARLDGRIDSLGNSIDGRIDSLGNRIDGLPSREEFSALRADVVSLRGEVGAMRSDLTQIALALGTRSQPQAG
jgi:uncharacterized protein DUF2730